MIKTGTLPGAATATSIIDAFAKARIAEAIRVENATIGWTHNRIVADYLGETFPPVIDYTDSDLVAIATMTTIELDQAVKERTSGWDRGDWEDHHDEVCPDMPCAVCATWDTPTTTSILIAILNTRR